MNTKLHLTWIGVILLLIATACSASRVSSSALDPAQPATRNDKAVGLVPVTGGQSSDVAPDLQAYPSRQLHRYCALEDNPKQANCVEKGSSQFSGSVLLSITGDPTPRAYPIQQVHSNCVSKDSQRQDRCIP